MDALTMGLYFVAIMQFVVIFTVRKTVWMFVQRTVFKRSDWPELVYYEGGTKLKCRLIHPAAKRIELGRGKNKWNFVISTKAHQWDETGKLVYFAVKGHPEAVFLGNLFSPSDTSSLHSTEVEAAYAVGFKTGLGNIAKFMKQNMIAVILSVMILCAVLGAIALVYEQSALLETIIEEGVKIKTLSPTSGITPASGPPPGGA